MKTCVDKQCVGIGLFCTGGLSAIGSPSTQNLGKGSAGVPKPVGFASTFTLAPGSAGVPKRIGSPSSLLCASLNAPTCMMVSELQRLWLLHVCFLL